MSRSRGQLVLVAALALIVALVPLVFAYLQLGYQDDLQPTQQGETGQIERTLDRALHDAAAETAGEYEWPQRTAAVAAVHGRLNGTIRELERAELTEGVIYEIQYNASRAAEWAAQYCPGGPDRQFGPCEAEGGVVVQERAGETHVLAVAVDIRTTATASEGRLRLVLGVQTG